MYFTVGTAGSAPNRASGSTTLEQRGERNLPNSLSNLRPRFRLHLVILRRALLRVCFFGDYVQDALAPLLLQNGLVVALDGGYPTPPDPYIYIYIYIY